MQVSNLNVSVGMFYEEVNIFNMFVQAHILSFGEQHSM